VSARYQLGHGIVIRRKALPSGDVVVTLLAEHGKWRGVARKGKLPGGNLGRLSLFHDVTVQYYRKREDDLALLTQVKLNGALPGLTDPAVYPYAHILAELADALTVDVHIGEPLYEYLASGLRGLGRHPDPERVALLYAWRLLQQAGLAPRARRCGVCGGEDPLEALDVGAGTLACGACGGTVVLGAGTADELRALLSAPMKEALAVPLHDRHAHWLALSRYLSYHVAELRSLASRFGREEAGAHV
jgi:DNA repair protein RecO (recombination protein O)